MALGNLSIKVTADIGSFTSGMDAAAIAARQGMGASAGSVDDFRQHLMRASNDLAQASRAMGANMEAANDAIVSSSARAADAVQGVSKSIDAVDTRSMHEKVAFAVGAGVGAGAAAGKTAIDAFIGYLKTQLVIAGLVILTGITAGVFTILYLAAKAVGTIGAMMDGSFYKSENIDALIATNKELLDLQKNLRISSIEAGALNEAMKRLNVDKADYKAVYEGATKSIHENGEELDRLGVKYKDQNGKLLENRQFLKNVKAELDKYTEGWDRNSAATAMGVGSYDKIVDVLRITDTELQTSKLRMDEYQLGITAGTQKMVAEYEQSMRDFDAENRMAGEGFKRVFADAVMPIYTDMANLFKEGWPSMVQLTRVGVSSIMFLVYSLADGIYIAKESIVASYSVIGTGLSAVAAASVKAMKGDFTGAKEALATGWEDAAKRVKLAGTNIVEQVMRNDRAILAATGNDGRDASLASSKLAPPVTGKTFVPKPKDAKAAGAGSGDDDTKKILQGQLAAQEAFIAAEKNQLTQREQALQYSYQQEYTNANVYYSSKQLLIKESLRKQIEAYAEEEAAAVIYLAKADTPAKQQDAKNIIAEINRKRIAAEIESNSQLTASVREQDTIYDQFRLTTDAVARSAALNNAQAQFQIDLLGKGTLEVLKLTEARRIDLALAQRIYDMRLKSAPQEKIDAAIADSLLQKNAALGLVEDSYNRQRTAIFGATEAMRKYVESTSDQAAQVEGAMTNAFKSAEDAFVEFAKTGKLNFRGLADSIISDLIRIQARQSIQSALGGSGGGGLAGLIGGLFSGGTKGNNPSAFVGGGGFMDTITSLFSGARANGGPVDGGGNYLVGERGPEMFTPSQSGSIIPNHKLGGGGENITIINQTTGRIDNVVSQSVSPGERQLIIQETREAVAADHYDPNSRVSRAMKNNYSAARVR